MTEKREGVRDTAREVCIDEVGGRERGRRAHTHSEGARDRAGFLSHFYSTATQGASPPQQPERGNGSEDEIERGRESPETKQKGGLKRFPEKMKAASLDFFISAASLRTHTDAHRMCKTASV